MFAKAKTKATDDESRVTDDASTRANAGDALYCVIFLIRAPRRRLSGRGRGATCEANLTNLRRGRRAQRHFSSDAVTPSSSSSSSFGD